MAAWAEDFLLTFRTLLPEDMMSFPGGYGLITPLRLAKPATLEFG